MDLSVYIENFHFSGCYFSLVVRIFTSILVYIVDLMVRYIYTVSLEGGSASSQNGQKSVATNTKSLKNACDKQQKYKFFRASNWFVTSCLGLWWR